MDLRKYDIPEVIEIIFPEELPTFTTDNVWERPYWLDPGYYYPGIRAAEIKGIYGKVYNRTGGFRWLDMTTLKLIL